MPVRVGFELAQNGFVTTAAVDINTDNSLHQNRCRHHDVLRAVIVFQIAECDSSIHHRMRQWLHDSNSLPGC